MKKLIVIFVIGGILGSGFGFAAAVVVYPFIFLDDLVASETLDKTDRQLVATGEFIHANPMDFIHWGKGPVSVYGDLVHIAEGFEVGPGPRYHVYLVDKKVIKNSADVESSKIVDLGRLKAFRGSQNYQLPPDIDLRKFGSVVIWCKSFGALISPATLKFSAS